LKGVQFVTQVSVHVSFKILSEANNPIHVDGVLGTHMHFWFVCVLDVLLFHK